jgi:glucan phosphoethanolaminetransferase (alkaline phosphatase superfamily)
MKQRQPVNYVYFGILFVVLSVLHVYHVFLIEQANALHRFFYSVYAALQCAIEVGGLLVLGHLLAPRFPRLFRTLFVVFTFILFLIHLIDFPLVRIMGMTFWFALDMIRAESMTNFIEMLSATHISLATWMLGAIAVVVIPLLGILFFRATHKLSIKRPVYYSHSAVGLGLFSALFFLSIFDFKTHTIAMPAEDGQFLQTLPWKTTLLTPARPQVQVGRLTQEPSEKEYRSKLEGMKITAVKKPNIFLFVTESLREDFLTPDVAPALSEFKKSNISFKHSRAAANGTHLSWFSIFQGVYPFYWDARRPSHWRSGSLPLQILKKAGYQIRVYSGSRLSYYQMDERLFGENHQLADYYRVFPDEKEGENYEHDRDCIAALTKDLTSYQEGNVFIVFLESTHFSYSFPEKETLYKAPKSLNFLGLTCSNDHAEGAKSRYRSAIHFIDKLFGQFTEKLNAVSGGEEAVVVFTGDHGEEFFEEGCIFHASNLNNMQTHVPIYFRLGAATARGPREVSSHLDIFPTILEYVLGHQYFETWFDGESILHPSRKNFTVSTRHNGNRCPFEFLIHDGKNQLVARFEDRYNIFKSRSLDIVAHRNEEGEPLEIELDQVRHDFKAPLETLFK